VALPPRIVNHSAVAEHRPQSGCRLRLCARDRQPSSHSPKRRTGRLWPWRRLSLGGTLSYGLPKA